MEDRAIEWSKLFPAREKIHKRYRSIWNVPLIKKRSALLRRILRDGMSLLDVGAGSKGLREEIEKIGAKVKYKSMDVDTNVPHDFYDINDVKEIFDVVLFSEVIEHMPFTEGVNMLKRLRDVLKDDGLILVSTPNIYHPNKFFTTADHKTYYAYDELAAVMDLTGYEVKELYRSFNDAFHRYVMKVYIFGFLFRFLEIDYAYTIFAIGKKRA
jgi:2-polyprenyl-3-methyl-5-hydroxy-6-metoxy-1,4-benzoquinol methylase